jgi:hypothetical protein
MGDVLPEVRICECGFHFCCLCMRLEPPVHFRHLCPYCADEALLFLALDDEYWTDAEVYEAELARRRAKGLPT